MARVVVAEYRGSEDKSGTLDDGRPWAHRRLNLEDEAGKPLFVKLDAARVGEFQPHAKGDMVAYVVDRYDRVQRELSDPEALAEFISPSAAHV